MPRAFLITHRRYNGSEQEFTAGISPGERGEFITDFSFSNSKIGCTIGAVLSSLFFVNRYLLGFKNNH